MASYNVPWFNDRFHRYRPFVLALTALAAGCTIYYLQDSLWFGGGSPPQTGDLHRSNAHRGTRSSSRNRRTRPRSQTLVHGDIEAPAHAAVQSSIAGARSTPDPGDAVHQINGSPSLTETLTRAGTVLYSDSAQSPPEEDDDHDKPNRDQSLMNLLYRIGEENERKQGYIHRGIICNSCSTMPICGIRYRCSNCADFDLCEQCEALQLHPKTHLFYKIRIPLPALGYSRQGQPCWYPGRPQTMTKKLSKSTMTSLCKETGYMKSEMEALWEQFKCLAASEWEEDPIGYNMAIDRRTFDKFYVSNISIRPSPPNLLYDRIFSFYDTNGDGLIGFVEFIGGLVSLKQRLSGDGLRKVFLGYDMDEDGFVNRRDFLRMFSAYYAQNKEMIKNINAGMSDDDGSDFEVRELVQGGRSLSAGFAGAIPPGQPSRASNGKIRDSFGDDVVSDRMGAVDEMDKDDIDPWDIIADMAETAKFPTVLHDSEIREICRSLCNDPWPPTYITMSDVYFTIGQRVEPENVIDADHQKAIRRNKHKQFAEECQHRQYLRRAAIDDRQNRQRFYLDDEDAMHLRKHSASQNKNREVAVPPTSISTCLSRLQTSEKDATRQCRALELMQKIKLCAVELISTLDWPVDSPLFFFESILMLSNEGWTDDEIVHNLRGYDSDASKVRDFVHDLSHLVHDITAEVDPTPGPESASTSVPPSRRSRSSSKVRFEDGLLEDNKENESPSVTSMSSRSIPLNERWGGFDVPEPEEDVGRDILHQVTQEAFNELLDPIFVLREDLRLEAEKTRDQRDQNREAIFISVVNPLSIEEHLEVFLKQYRVSLSFEKKLLVPRRGIVEILAAFIQEREASEKTSLTTELCSSCKIENVAMGGWCSGCGQPSFQVSLANHDRQAEEVKCQSCGVINPTGDDVCQGCGFTIQAIIEAKNAFLRRILAGNREDLKQRIIDPLDPAKADAAQTSQASKSLASVDETRNQGMTHDSVDTLPDGPHEPGSSTANPLDDVSTTEEEAGDSGLQQAESVSGNEAVDSTYPEMALDLHDAVSTFNAADLPAVEENIAKKPLEELLAESGYGLESLDDQTPDIPDHQSPPRMSDEESNSPVPDPTLPQNRPDSTPSQPGPSATAGKATPKASVPDEYTLKSMAALDILVALDEARGGPGRLSFEEFEEVMKGERGPSLGFLGSWLDQANL